MPNVKKQNKKAVRVAGGAKDTIATRVDTGVVVDTNAPTSPILLAHQDVQQSEANFVTISKKLDAKDTLVKSLEVELGTERGALANLVVEWNSLYDVYVSTARIYCVTEEDAKALGLPAAGITLHTLTMPLSVSARWDVKNALVRIHVKRPPGLRSVRIEISPDPMTTTSFKALDGDGATAKLPGYAPGTYWVRAAMIRGREVSDYSTPVAVIVK